jgi:hypothetical protein
MSFHDQLDDLVGEAKADHLKQLGTIKSLMAKMKSEWLPAFFGGGGKDYKFFHPTEADEGRKDDLSHVLPEKGKAFAVGLAIKAGVNFTCFLRVSNVTKDKADLKIIGSDKVHHLPGEEGVRGFCKELFEAAKKALADHAVQESTKTVAVNVYE